MKRIIRTMTLTAVTALLAPAAHAGADPCIGTTPIRSAAVDLAIPKDQTVSGLAVLIKFPAQAVTLPNTVSDRAVAERVTNRPDKAIVAAHVNEDTIRVVLARAEVFAPGQLIGIDFDSCRGASTPVAADFSCSVEGCANQFGAVEGCTCAVRLP
ncbi:MAG TPA: hypothetical protein VMW17_22395 [Candidatus Binatia bacterium]|nr:hypothetical protein [Candidatus Binatia bacterium]